MLSHLTLYHAVCHLTFPDTRFDNVATAQIAPAIEEEEEEEEEGTGHASGGKIF